MSSLKNRLISYRYFFSKTLLIKDHVLVILFFILITGLFTYPSYLQFDSLIGNHGDPDQMLNTFWWYNYSIRHQDETSNLSWLFYHDYQFYPLGVPLSDASNLLSYLSIPLYYIMGDFVKTYNILMYAALIFSGYGTFLLAKHITNNYHASIISGIIFTFGIYHMYQGTGHLVYASTEFIPFSILYLIKTTESKKIINPILGGVFLFLVLITVLYFSLFMLFFLAAFLSYLIIRKEKLETFSRVGFLLLIAVVLTTPFYYYIYESNLTSTILDGRPLSEFTAYSTDLANYFLPAPNHNITKIFNNPLGTSINNPETWAFLGYTAMFLALIGIFKTDKRKTILWILSGIILAIISMGPFLKILNYDTGIPLPYLTLYGLPFFNLFRVISRASILVTLSISILAAYGIVEISKIRALSSNKKLFIIIFLGFLVVMESLTIPFPTDDLKPSPIYYAISNDPTNSVVLESPIGLGTNSIRDAGFDFNRSFSFFQTVHEKPVYSGFQSRPPEEQQRFVQTYFLNQFIWDQPPNDIVTQNINDVGISILNYYNIGYVIAHRNVGAELKFMHNQVTQVWFPQTQSLLFDIFNKNPDYTDEQLISYKVPKSTSTIPFLILGKGWSPLTNSYRLIGNNATIKIINPGNEIKPTEIKIDFDSMINNKLQILFNGEKIFEDKINGNASYQASIATLNLNPSENNLIFILDNTFESDYPSVYGNGISFAVKQIYINNHPSIISNSTHIQELKAKFPKIEWIRLHLNQLYHKYLQRGVDPTGEETWINYIMNEGKTIEWVEDQIKNSPEYMEKHQFTK